MKKNKIIKDGFSFCLCEKNEIKEEQSCYFKTGKSNLQSWRPSWIFEAFLSQLRWGGSHFAATPVVSQIWLKTGNPTKWSF